MVSASGVVKQVVAVAGLEDSSEYGYSQCVRVGSMVFLAGQCGLGNDHEVISPEFEPQARRALERMRAAVEAAGGAIEDIVSMTVFITDVRLGRVFTRLRREFFGTRFPASALIGVAALMPTGAMIEIQAIAVLAGGRAETATPAKTRGHAGAGD